MPFLGFLKYSGLMGTGFAPPKITGEPENAKKAGSRIVIIKSICLIGFRVSRPSSKAVLSPNKRAM